MHLQCDTSISSRDLTLGVDGRGPFPTNEPALEWRQLPFRVSG
jgi:hypothetical protein